MKDVVWDNILSVDVDEIDEDHRKLIEIYNLLNHSLKAGESPKYLSAILDELVNCTIWHFSHEERLMLKYDYSEMEQHKAIHQELIKSAQELQEQVKQTDGSVTEEDIDFLEHWLVEHILTDDMRLGDYLFQVM